MNRLTQEQFVAKLGDPAKFTHRGQFYDGRTPTTPCICGRKIRFCFIVYTGAKEKVTLGSCCFKYFASTRLFDILEATQVVLLNVVVETQKATKETEEKEAFAKSRKNWNKVRREALSRIAAHRKATGKEWLPEILFDIRAAAAVEAPGYTQPKKASNWFQTKTEFLRKKLAEADKVPGTIGNEIAAKHQG